MKRAAIALLLVTLGVPLTQWRGIAHASGGNATAQTVSVDRADCSSSGPSVGTARFSLDDQGGNPGGIEVRTAISTGLPRTNYSVSLLQSPCTVITVMGTLKTDDSGRGDLDVHVVGSLLSPGAALRVQLVAPGDILTSDPVSGL